MQISSPASGYKDSRVRGVGGICIHGTTHNTRTRHTYASAPATQREARASHPSFAARRRMTFDGF